MPTPDPRSLSPDPDLTDRPRWAKELPEADWERLGELMDAGWGAPDILRELQLPESKLRSLQLHVQRHGPRRRLTQFAKFKDVLLSQIEVFGADLVQSLSVIASRAVSNETKPAVQVRAVEVMAYFTRVLAKLLEADQESVRGEKSEKGVNIDAGEVIRRVLAEYGVKSGQD